MASNNYFGFTHNGTQYATAAASPGYQSAAQAYGVAAAPGVTAGQTFSTQRTGTVYDSAAAAAYQAATPVTYTVAPGTPAVSSYDYTAYTGGRTPGTAGGVGVGVTYDSAKTYYQQAASQQATQQAAIGVSQHVVAASPVGSAVSSNDLQGWQQQNQNYGNRQSTGATGTGKSTVYHASYSTVPTTRQLSVPKMQSSSNASYMTQQQQQQQYLAQQQNTVQQQYAASMQQNQQQSPIINTNYGYSVQGQSQTLSKASSVGTIGQPKKVYQQQTAGSSTAQNPSAYSNSYNAAVSTYGTAYPLNTVHNANTSAGSKQVGGTMVGGQQSATTTGYPYDAALINAALYLNQGGINQRNNTTTGKSGFKPRPGLGSTPRPQRPRMPPKPQQLHYCDACKISCAGPGAYHDHLQGQKHKKRVAKPKVEPATTSSNSAGLPIFTCELCDVECTAADAYAAHLRGAKHTKVVKLHTKLGKPIPTPDPKATLAVAALNTVHDSGSGLKANKTSGQDGDKEDKDGDAFIDDRPAVGMEFIDEEKDPSGKLLNYNCKLCDCKFSDPNAKEMHMKGRKHRLAFKKKVDPQLQVEIKTPFNKFRKERLYGRKKGSKKPLKTTNADGTVKEEVPGGTDGEQDTSGSGQSPRGIRRTARGSRMLAEEGEHRLWEQEYRRYEEDLKEYRDWCRRFGGTAVPPPMPGMIRDPYMRSPLMSVNPLMPPGLRFRGQPAYMMGYMTGPQPSMEDRHINARHKMICPNDAEVKLINKAVTIIEKSVRLVSDVISSAKDKELADVVKKEPGTQGTPEATKISAADGGGGTGFINGGPNRILTGINRVGMFSKTLLLQGDNMAEMVLVCSVKPTLTLLKQVVSLLPEQLKILAKEEMEFNVIAKPSSAGFEISCTNKDERQLLNFQIRVIVTMTSPVVREEILALQENSSTTSNDGTGGSGSSATNTATNVITPDPPDVLSKTKCLEALAAVRHAKWFQARVVGYHNCVTIIRILKDLCRRVPTWTPFDSWPMELLVERIVSSHNGALGLGDSLRRVFEAISAGIILPDGVGLQDPCEKDPVDSAKHLLPQEREDITASAQHALRMIAFGQIHKVLGMEKLPTPKLFHDDGANHRKRRRENSAGKSEVVDGKKDKKDDELAADIKMEVENAAATSSSI